MAAQPSPRPGRRRRHRRPVVPHDVIAEVMAEYGVDPVTIPLVSVNIDQRRIPPNERYFKLKGFANFRCSLNGIADDHECSNAWSSAHVWCVIDLKTQDFARTSRQQCKLTSCDAWRDPKFGRDEIRRMAIIAVQCYLGEDNHPRRASRPPRRTPAHKQSRCSECRMLKSPCWK